MCRVPVNRFIVASVQIAFALEYTPQAGTSFAGENVERVNSSISGLRDSVRNMHQGASSMGDVAASKVQGIPPYAIPRRCCSCSA